jgi:hypothetical protein
MRPLSCTIGIIVALKMSSTVVETPESVCLADSSKCVHHFHDSDPNYLDPSSTALFKDNIKTTKHNVSGVSDQPESLQNAGCEEQSRGHTHIGLRMIIHNFTPSYVHSSFPDAGAELMILVHL